MFNYPTVLVLGAGASAHYGYPTGNDLVRLIAHTLRNDVFHDSYGESYKLGDWDHKYREFESKLTNSSPQNIDYFLAINPSLAEIGKIMISYQILLAENSSVNSTNKGGDWYARHLLHALTSRCKRPEDILDNKLSVITFNYDVSLEHYLYKLLLENEIFKSHALKFMENLEIIHIYGKVYDFCWEIGSSQGRCIKNYGSLKANIKPKFIGTTVYKEALKLEGNIKVIGEHKSTDDEVVELSTRARQLLKDAHNIYILGFGFDSNNMELLDLEKNLEPRDNLRVYYTNMGNIQKIENKMDAIFRNKYVESHSIVRKLGSNYMSTGNIYEALESDFEFGN